MYKAANMQRFTRRYVQYKRRLQTQPKDECTWHKVSLHYITFQIQRVGCYATPLFTARHCAIRYESVAVAPEPVPGAPEPTPVAPEAVAVTQESESEDSESECVRFGTLL